MFEYNISMGIGYAKPICEKRPYAYCFLKLKNIAYTYGECVLKNMRIWLPFNEVHMCKVV